MVEGKWTECAEGEGDDDGGEFWRAGNCRDQRRAFKHPFVQKFGRLLSGDVGGQFWHRKLEKIMENGELER